MEEEAQINRPGLFELFLLFLRVGAVAFGGLAVIEYFRKVAVERKRWMDEDTFNYGIAISQALPGPPTAKVATYVGLRARGPMGAGVALVSYLLPTFSLMLVLSWFYMREHNLKLMTEAFDGLQVVILAIVVDAIFSLGRSLVKTYREVAIAVASALLFMASVNPMMVILVAALLGALIYEREPFRNLQGATRKEGYPYRAAAALLIFAVAGFALLYFLDRKLFDISAAMFRVGAFCFGGGFGAIPLMLHEVVSKYKWMDTPTLMNGIALGTITPGPILITATFIGFWVRGFLGALLATIAIFYPTLLMMVATVPYFDKLAGSKYFNKAIGGVLCSFLGLFLSVAVTFSTQVHWDYNRVLLAAAAFLALRLKVDIMIVVLAGVVVSVLVFR
jgi:chromate transporter